MGKKGGSETTTVELPPELKQAAIDNLGIANEVAAVGYTPYSGPTVAGFTPGQRAAFANTDAAASAFGMPGVAPMGASRDPLTGIPLNSMDTNGNFSPLNIVQAAIAAMPPKQRAMIESFVTNPQTGAWPSNPAVPRPQFSPANPASTPVQQFPNAPVPTLAPAAATRLSPYEEWSRKRLENRGGTR